MRKLAFVLAFSLACIQAQAEDRNDFFETKIRPLLIARCASCHGDKVQMAGVQLTSKDGLHRSGVVVPGDPEASRIVQAIRHTSKIKMPPDAKLLDQEIRVIERWVADGAIWPEASGIIPVASATTHWAFRPVKKPEAPFVKAGEWPRSDIDRFILAKLEEKKLTPVPDAGKYHLLRRVTLDLTGLLPTADEIATFEKDSSPQAFARVIIPLSLPGIAAGCILIFGVTASVYTTTVMLGGGRVLTTPVQIAQEFQMTLNYPMASALSVTLAAVTFGLAMIGIKAARTRYLEASS